MEIEQWNTSFSCSMDEILVAHFLLIAAILGIGVLVLFSS